MNNIEHNLNIRIISLNDNINYWENKLVSDIKSERDEAIFELKRCKKLLLKALEDFNKHNNKTIN